MRRWVCPQCGGGVNGIERPRKDDVRRYCLDCSAKTGRLVERTCPALEKRREVRSEKAAAKRNALKDRERSAAKERYTLGDLDLIKEADRLWRLPVMKEQAAWQPRVPHLDMRWSKTKAYTSGRSYGGRIVVTAGTNPWEVREVLLHELVHEALPRNVHHQDPFYRVLLRAAREAWPHVEFPPMPRFSRAWARDKWISETLQAGES
jgi:hypothetical protein